jgi:hypothetical protein
LAFKLRNIQTKEYRERMRKIVALTVLALASQAVATFAGEPVVSSKEVIAPAPPPPPPEFFGPNEFCPASDGIGKS